jgi:hypothetical protein
MKKIFLTLGICFILIAMPIMTANPMKQIRNPRIKTLISEVEKQTPALDEPPEWANGEFAGVWGMTILGFPTPPMGWVAGYYQEIGLGTLAGVFGPFNGNATGAIAGAMLWIFFMGGVEILATGEGTYVAGIGVANETHYYMRLHGILGPNYYMSVEYTRFPE